MYFSRTKKRLFRDFCFVAVTLVCLLWLLASLPLLQSSICAACYWLPASSLCNVEKSIPYPLLFYHLGGNGPWTPRAHANGINVDLPASCSIQQAHMLLRHAERYPTKNAGARHVALLKKLQDPALSLSGSLSFLHAWSYFMDLNTHAFGSLIKVGPYAGTSQAYKNGEKLGRRYAHLILPHTVTKFWTCDSPRDIETSRHFADGFFGYDWESSQRAKLYIIPETSDRGADTLTPGVTCTRYKQDKIEGRDRGYIRLAKWQEVFSANISARLRDNLGGVQLSPPEIYSMMEMCGFEILVRGQSPWCDIFTKEEWSQFEYARDLLHFYRAGPGNKYAGAMGQLWLNAAHEIMARDIHQGVYLSFVHDSDIVALFAALGVLDEVGTHQWLPVDFIKEDRRWRTSDVTPMGGYLVLEKLQCSENDGVREPKHLVRLLVNDGLFNLSSVISPSHVDGAAILEHFGAYVKQRAERFGNFSEVCELSPDAASRITFFDHET